MGTLFGALNNSLSALEAFQNAMDVAQNNVSNASTPGYASQTATFVADPLNLTGGLDGGVASGPTQSTDSRYADQAVQTQMSLLGSFTAQSTALSSIQSLFDVTGQTGVIGALNNLFQSFSAWATTPDSSSTEQNVLSQASALAQELQSAAASLSQTTGQVNQQIGSAVQQINTLAGQIANDNAALSQSSPPDPGIQANLESSLESLSQLANTTVTYAANGAATVLLGGQTPLVIGNQQYSIQANFSGAGSGGNPNAVPDAQILDSNGTDITSQISQGTLGGLLNVRNTVLPSLQGNSQQQGALNILAQQVADRVNQILTAGTTPGGAPGTALFTYSSASPVDVAATLALNPAITASGLAAADASGGNGAALQLSNLGDSTASGDEINGQTIVQYAASVATQIGQQASNAQTGQTLQTQLVSQAQAMQTQISGVNLNAEAALIMQLQQGYDAAGKVVTVISSLATTLINMIPATG
jgi:flagellar hook-associated protein 1